MKHKFLITNDVGLALDQVKFLIEEMQVCGGELYGEQYSESLLEIKQRLEQTLETLEEGEED